VNAVPHPPVQIQNATTTNPNCGKRQSGFVTSTNIRVVRLQQPASQPRPHLR
jgi:hypothetical protein